MCVWNTSPTVFFPFVCAYLRNVRMLVCLSDVVGKGKGVANAVQLMAMEMVCGTVNSYSD